MLTCDVPGGGLPERAAPYYRDLLARGMNRKHALNLLGKVYRECSAAVIEDPPAFCGRLRAETARQIRATGGIEITPGQPKTVALVGTTGTGKTTTLAKIAAHYALRRKVRVALVTTDTYRIAAAQQLQVYADIIGLPLRVVNDAGELTQALEAFAEHDLILLDTPGGSPFNVQYLRELQDMLRGANELETILVLSAASQPDDLAQAIENLRSLGPSSLLFTKLDETRRFGLMFSVLKDTGLPVSYLCIGQNVPNDIRIAQPHALAGLVVEGKSDRGGSSK
jgi:flagellar biosynthesis protein FlhF